MESEKNQVLDLKKIPGYLSRSLSYNLGDYNHVRVNLMIDSGAEYTFHIKKISEGVYDLGVTLSDSNMKTKRMMSVLEEAVSTGIEPNPNITDYIKLIKESIKFARKQKELKPK